MGALDKRWTQAILVTVWILNLLLAIGMHCRVCCFRPCEKAETTDQNKAVLLTFVCFVCAASVYFLMNWNIIVWIVGSNKWAVVCEVVLVVCLIHMACFGFCVLGWERNMESSSINTSKRTLITVMLVIPCIIFGMFLFLTIITLGNTGLMTAYVHRHTAEMFLKADKYPTDGVLSYFEFQQYTLSLPQFAGMNNTQTRARLIQLYDAIDTSLDDAMTQSEMNHAILSGLKGPRLRLGYSVLTITIVSFCYIVLYWTWHSRLKGDSLTSVQENDIEARLVTTKRKKKKTKKSKKKKIRPLEE